MRVPLTTLLYLLPSLPLLSSQKPHDRFATESRLVLVNATVLDAQNRVRTDLQAKDFSLYEDGQPVQVQSVSLEDVPTSTIILLDVSGSMKTTIGYEREVLERFLAKTRPGDEYCLVLFSNKVEPECDFDSDPHSVRAKAARAVPEGDTSVIDALMFGLNRVKDAHNTRRAILVLSDALDTSSRYKWREARNYALESTATIYAVSPPVWDDAGQANSLELKEDRRRNRRAFPDGEQAQPSRGLHGPAGNQAAVHDFIPTCNAAVRCLVSQNQPAVARTKQKGPARLLAPRILRHHEPVAYSFAPLIHSRIVTYSGESFAHRTPPP